jgi:hypothetical protein
MTPYVDPYDDTPSQTFYGEVLPRYEDSPPPHRRVRETDLVASDGANTFHLHVRLEEADGVAADRQRQYRLTKLNYRAQVLGVVFGALSFLVATAALLGPFPQLMTAAQRWSADHPWLFGLLFFGAIAVVCFGGVWLTGHRLFVFAGEATLGAILVLGVVRAVRPGGLSWLPAVGKWLYFSPRTHPWLAMLVFVAIAVGAFWASYVTESFLLLLLGSFSGGLAIASALAAMIRQGWFDWVAVAGRWLVDFPFHHPWITAAAALVAAIGLFVWLDRDKPDHWWFVVSGWAAAVALITLGIVKAALTGWFAWVVDLTGWIGAQAGTHPWILAAITLAVGVGAGIAARTAWVRYT